MVDDTNFCALVAFAKIMIPKRDEELQVHICKLEEQLKLAREAQDEVRNVERICGLVKEESVRTVSENEFIPLADAAERLGVKPSTLKEYCQKKLVAAEKNLQKRWIVDLNSARKHCEMLQRHRKSSAAAGQDEDNGAA